LKLLPPLPFFVEKFGERRIFFLIFLKEIKKVEMFFHFFQKFFTFFLISF